MTIIAGIREKHDYDSQYAVYMGCDSVGSNGYSARPNATGKLFKRRTFLYGVAGSYRVGQVIRYQFHEPDHPEHVSDSDYIYGIWLDALRKTFRDTGCLEVVNNVEGIGIASALVGYHGRLFTLQTNLSLIEEMDGLHAIGSGDQICLGAMFALSKLKPEKRIQKAMEIVGQVQPGAVGGPYFVEEL